MSVTTTLVNVSSKTALARKTGVDKAQGPGGGSDGRVALPAGAAQALALNVAAVPVAPAAAVAVDVGAAAAKVAAVAGPDPLDRLLLHGHYIVSAVRCCCTVVQLYVHPLSS